MNDQIPIIKEIIDATEVGLIYCDHKGLIELANKSALNIFKAEREKLIGLSIDILLPLDKQKVHEEHRRDFEKNPGTRSLDERQGVFAKRMDGQHFPAEVALNPIHTPAGMGILCTVVDITTRAEREKKIEEFTRELLEKNNQLKELSSKDSLTGVYNRRAFSIKVLDAIEQGMSDKLMLSIAFIDIDKFKTYNDEHGHGSGDRLLVSVADLLGRTSRDTDCIARFGGDEFVMFLMNTGKKEAEQIAKRIINTIQADAVHVGVGLSIGVATQTSVGEGDTPEKILDRLLLNADKALYKAKKDRETKYAHFNDL